MTHVDIEKRREQQKKLYWFGGVREKKKAYYKEHPRYKKFEIDANCKRVGRIGEVSFLTEFPNAKWIGRPYDGECNLGKVDIKTSRPTNHRNGKMKWKFHLLLQRGIVDSFILFFLTSESKIEKVMIIPDAELKVNDITVVMGSPSKYDRYTINLQ